MNQRSHTLFVEDILEAMNKIQRYCQGLSREDFIKNELVIDGVIRNLEVIGEAAKNIPEEIKIQYPEIPWRRMIGLRNMAIHEYFGVDLDITWKIVSENIPETIPKIEAMLKNSINKK